MMEFDWDDRKNADNVSIRQIPFELAGLLFREETLEEDDNRWDYGELRIRAYGKVNGRLFVCIYTDRMLEGRLVRWIISLRKANKREVRKYDEAIKAESSEQSRS